MTTIRDKVPMDRISREAVLDALDFLGIDLNLPAEWATVDRCLTWLRERGIDGQAAGWTDGFAVHLVGSERPISAATLHAALIAACKAV